MQIKKSGIGWIIGWTMLVLTACSNVDSDLEDKWQLRQYQYADGSVEKEDSVFYNFQKGSFSAICLSENGSYQTFFGNYSWKGAEISIILLPKSVEEEDYDLYMGWEDGKRTFAVEELTASSLRLEHKGIRYLFRRY